MRTERVVSCRENIRDPWRMDGFSRSWTGGGYTDGGAQARGRGDCSVVSTSARGPAGEGRGGGGTQTLSWWWYWAQGWWNISNLKSNRIRALSQEVSLSATVEWIGREARVEGEPWGSDEGLKQASQQGEGKWWKWVRARPAGLGNWVDVILSICTWVPSRWQYPSWSQEKTEAGQFCKGSEHIKLEHRGEVGVGCKDSESRSAGEQSELG